MTRPQLVALVLVVLGGAPAAARELLPPPPPPPADDGQPPPQGGTHPGSPTGTYRSPSGAAAPGNRNTLGSIPALPPPPPGTIGDGPVAQAGAPGSNLKPDERATNWRLALATGVAFRSASYKIDTGPDPKANSSMMLYFGGQANGAWSDGFGSAARLRLRLLTGGESLVFLPSDGEVEAAYMIGRPEFRFVLGRIEVARYTGVAINTLAQVATAPCVEGTVAIAGDKVRFYYGVAPVELAYVWYMPGAHVKHLSGWVAETDHPDAASAFRARITFMVPPSVLLSLGGDVLKFWNSADLLTTAEAAAGVAILDRSVLINLSIRWENFTRRGLAPNSTDSANEFLGLATATLVF
jgi:hypothetical protein